MYIAIKEVMTMPGEVKSKGRPKKSGENTKIIEAKVIEPDIINNQIEKPKHPGGRPPKFKNPEELQAIVNSYIENTRQEDTIPTLNGLSLFANVNRDTIAEYQNKPEFTEVIKKVTYTAEKILTAKLTKTGNATAGVIFALKNICGWSDNQKVEISGNADKPLEVVFTVKAPNITE